MSAAHSDDPVGPQTQGAARRRRRQGGGRTRRLAAAGLVTARPLRQDLGAQIIVAHDCGVTINPDGFPWLAVDQKSSSDAGPGCAHCSPQSDAGPTFTMFAGDITLKYNVSVTRWGSAALATERVKRRLIAVLAADIAGYSRLTELDEAGTLARLRAHRRELIDPKIDEHGGRVVRATDDSLLAEFASPGEAVRCAVEMQRGMIERNVNTAPDRRVAFRVGVNTGEVTTDEGDLVSRAVAALSADRLATLIKPDSEFYGDVGNIAVRVAALAEPGGVCISDPVREAVGDQLPYVFKDIGSQNLGRGGVPVRCYALTRDATTWRSHVYGQMRGVSAPRRMSLGSAVVAGGAFVTVGIWAVALWAWLDADSLTASLAALKTFGSQMASVGSTATGKGSSAPAARQSASISDVAADSSPAPAARQSAPMSDTTASSSDEASVPPPLPVASSVAAEEAPQAPTPRLTSPDSATAVLRGNQPAPPPLMAINNPPKATEPRPAPELQSPPIQPAVAPPVVVLR